MNDFNSADSEDCKKKSQMFLKKLESDLYFKSDYSGKLLSFDWLDKIEEACPFIDIIIRIPKIALIREEEIVKVERAKNITVASIKNLSKHTEYINKVDKKTSDVEPNKILNIRNEETYNIYENVFLYTLVRDMDKFIASKEKLLDNFELRDNKLLEYTASTSTPNEKVNIVLKLMSESLPISKIDDELKEELKAIKLRLKRVKEYLGSWEKSEMIKALNKAHVSFIKPPIKKTNLILKNPNFRVAVSLWEFLNNYDIEKKEDDRENPDQNSSDILRGFIDHSFLIDYFVMDSMTSYKREQKKNMAKYAVILLTEEIRRIVSLLLSSGYKITDEELLEIIAQEINREKNERFAGADDVKKKFKSALDEYLERVQDYLQ